MEQEDIGIWISDIFDLFTPEDQDNMSRAIRCIRKLKTEVKELEEKPWDPAEAADCMIALLSVAYFQNYDLMEEVEKKMKINYGREWKLNKNGTISHIKKEKKGAAA